MYVVSVENKEVEVIMAFSLKDLFHLYRSLKRADINYDTRNKGDEGMNEAVQFIQATFFPFLQNTREKYYPYFERFLQEDINKEMKDDTTGIK